jgi:hypothetical protein
MILHTDLNADASTTSFALTIKQATINIRPGQFPADYDFFVTCYLQAVSQIGVTIGDLEGFGRGEASVSISSYTIKDNSPTEGGWRHLLVKNLTSVTFTLMVSAANAQAAGFVFPYPP